MTNSKTKKTPKPTGRDAVHKMVKIGILGIPFVGSSAAELFSTIIVPPLSKRRDEWIESIAEGLERLEKEVEGFKIEELSDNSKFITTVMHASQAAIRNHQEEKLRALRNAVLNSALPDSPKEDMQLMFLNFVDVLTPSHLRLLKFFMNPQHPLAILERQSLEELVKERESRRKLAFKRFEPLREKYQMYDQLIKDLSSKGLIDLDVSAVHILGPVMEGDDIDPLEALLDMPWRSCVTQFGLRFLEFIRVPLKGDDTELFKPVFPKEFPAKYGLPKEPEGI